MSYVWLNGARFTCRFVAIALLGALFAPLASAQDCALERPLNSQRTTVLPNNRLFPVDVGGDRLNILFHWDDLPNTDVAPADGIPDMVQTLVDQIDTSLDSFDDAGFRNIPGVRKCSLDNVYTIYVYQSGICNSDGGPVECAPGGNGTAAAFDFRFTQNQKDRSIIDQVSRNTIAHEVFHSVQLNYALSDPQQYLIEGTATLMPDLIDSELDSTSNDSPSGFPGGNPTCEVVYLRSPQFNLVRRFNARFQDNSNVCSTKLFWRYFTEQVGENRMEPSYGIDAIVDLLALTTDRPQGWRIRQRDDVIGAGDFDGDGREELLVQSDTHIGLIASTFGRNRILNVTAAGGRLGQDGWLLNRADDLLLIGDFNGDGKDEFLIRSRSHTGIIGLDRNNRFRTLAAVLHGAGRFGNGWVPRRNDRVLGAADLNGDGADEILLKSRRYVGLVGLTPGNQTRTVAVRHQSGLSPTVLRVLSGSARVRSAADLNGDGRAEFINRDNRGIYTFGLSEGGQFVSLASLDWRDELLTEDGQPWHARRIGDIRGSGDLAIDGFPDSGRDEFIVQNPRDFAILAFDELAGFYVRGNYAVGQPFGNSASYTPALEIIAVHDMDGIPGAELVTRQANEIGILKIDPVFVFPNQIGSRVNGEFGDGELSIARLNGGSRGHILNRAPERWRTMAYYPVPGLVEESQAQVGRFLDDLITRMDQMVRANSSRTRNFRTLWRDFTIALYTKHLDVRTLNSAYFFVDEQADNFEYHHATADGSPPVVNVAIDTVSDPEFTAEMAGNNRWSSAYYRVLSQPNNAQSVVVNLIPERGQGRFSVTVVTIEGDRLVSMDRDANPRGGLLLKRYGLAPGQELGVIVSMADDAPDYTIKVFSAAN